MSSSVRAKAVNFDEDSMWVQISDGRTIGVPLAWFPRLLHGSVEQREQVSLSSRGLHWEALDEDIALEGLLAGRGDQTRPLMGPMATAVTGAIVPPMRTTGVDATVVAADAVKAVQMRLRVGHREVAMGSTRVHSYIVERLVEPYAPKATSFAGYELPRLYENWVTLERYQADRGLAAADEASIRERITEVRATEEARVIEEIGINKEASDRVETVRDTVRQTEV